MSWTPLHAALGLTERELTFVMIEQAIRSGYADLAGAATFGLAKGSRAAGNVWKKRNIAKYPKGGSNAAAAKQQRKRIVSTHKSYNRKVVRRADGLDRAYGAGSLGYTGYTSVRNRRK